jgi:hypothetical protein
MPTKNAHRLNDRCAFFVGIHYHYPKGVFTMTQEISFDTFTSEQAITWLRHHTAVMHAYAFALAQKANLSPAEAAHLFVDPWHANMPPQPPATAETLEQQARQIVMVLALEHGAQSVHIEHPNDTWLIITTLSDPEAMQRYGTPPEFHIQWLYEQLCLVCGPKGIICTAWLNDTTQYIQLSLQPTS